MGETSLPFQIGAKAAAIYLESKSMSDPPPKLRKLWERAKLRGPERLLVRMARRRAFNEAAEKACRHCALCHGNGWPTPCVQCEPAVTAIRALAKDQLSTEM